MKQFSYITYVNLIIVVFISFYHFWLLLPCCRQTFRDFELFLVGHEVTQNFNKSIELSFCYVILVWLSICILVFLHFFQKANVWFHRDFDAHDLRIRLPAVVSKLHKAINQNGGVTYVHCTAGLGRAPAVTVCI